jgi:S1-C subfamily serine protease
MASLSGWQIAPSRQPDPADYAFDLEGALASIVALRTIVPDDAFTAETLGTERAGHGVVIRDGIVLTIGYVITEADEIWISLADGSVVAATPLGYDQATGFGLVQALGALDAPALPLGSSSAALPGMRVVVGGAGGRKRSLAARIVARQEFAGYWEYVLDEAIFTAPAHPFWGGAALIGPEGNLLGIGSLQVEQKNERGESANLNMIVPIDILKPILPDLLATGRAQRPPRPWLGLFATEIDEKVVAAGLYGGGPSDEAGVKPGDILISVAGKAIGGLADFFRKVWALGPAGVAVPVAVYRDGKAVEMLIASADRDAFLRKPKMHS